MRHRLIAALGAAACSALIASGAGAHALVGLPIGTQGVSSANVHELQNIPTTTGVGGVFYGHYYFETISDPVSSQAYITPAAVGGLGVFDISNPEKPKLAGFLPLPHWQNEDVSISTDRKLLTISDDYKVYAPGSLDVIDIAKPASPKLMSHTVYPDNGIELLDGIAKAGGTGHIATFMGKGRYSYITGGHTGSALVVDLKNPSSPKFVGYVHSPAGNTVDGRPNGQIHDSSTDLYGNVWMSGSGGTAMYAPFNEADPMHPLLLAAISKDDNKYYDHLIHHNAIREDKDTVLITEEVLPYGDRCGPANETEKSGEDGSLQTWHIDVAHHRITPLTTYHAPRGSDDTGGLNAGSVISLCSSHWFTMNSNKIVADAWYSAGLRFFDVSDPKHIRLIGYFVGNSTVASQARFVPGRPDLVYVADYVRGLDVVKITGASAQSPTVVSPPFKASPRQRVQKDPSFGWMCAIPSAATDVYGLGFSKVGAAHA